MILKRGNTIRFIWPSIFLFAVNVLAKVPPEVNLDNLGTLIGKESRTRGNRIIHSFQGIPYAASPSGANRFQAPIPKVWSGEWNATSPGKRCLQPEYRHDAQQADRNLFSENKTLHTPSSADDPEDCLTLNVYTPDLSHNGSLPVVVYYHGGGFMVGSESSFRPFFLLDRDVVLVVPQYRLGPFGFLSMQNELIPGNAGLLDTLEALKWVNKHIFKFGGNKNKVTVSGQSAGASISNYLMLSPLAKGLLHGVIMNSGSAIAPWALEKTPLRDATQIASLAGCNKGDSQSLSECLLNLPAEELLEGFVKYRGKGGIPFPVLSRPDGPSETKIVPENPADLAKKGAYANVPLLIGVTKHDSMWIVNDFYNKLKSTGRLDDETYIRENLVDDIMKSEGIHDTVGTINYLIEHRYFGYISPQKRGNATEILAGLLDFVNTISMKAPALQMAKLNLKADNYLYTFDYQGRYHSPTHGIDDIEGVIKEGVTHSDDMIYLSPRVNAPFNDEETAISNIMVDLWSNFIISGNPNEPKKLSIPYWPRYNTTDKYYYKINKVSTAQQDFTNEFTAVILDRSRNSAVHFSSSRNFSATLILLVLITYFKCKTVLEF